MERQKSGSKSNRFRPAAFVSDGNDPDGSIGSSSGQRGTFNGKYRFNSHEETRSLVDKFPAWRFDPQVLVPCLVTTGDALAALYKTAGVSQPKCIHCPQPPYTDEARKAHQQGAVKLDAIIDERGRVSAATLVQGDDYGLATQAMGALKNWRFEPAAKDGKPARVYSRIEITFHLY